MSFEKFWRDEEILRKKLLPAVRSKKNNEKLVVDWKSKKIP